MSFADWLPLIHMPQFMGVAPGYQWILLLRIGVGALGMCVGISLCVAGVIYERPL